MMTQTKLVIADVDGTLVTQDKLLTPRAIEAVKKMRAAGIRFAITSGRPPRGMKMVVDPLQITEPVAAFNGGVLVQPDLTTVLKQKFLPPQAAGQVIENISAHGMDVWLYTDQDWFVRDPKAPHVAREEWTVKFPPKVVPGFTGLLDRVVKIVGVSDDHDLVIRCENDVRQACGAQVSAARSQPYYLDVTHPEANKGQVVIMMSELLKVPPEQIATIGDGVNDILMFKKSGISIAMGNASDEVKLEATYVTASNEEDGFAKAMEQYVLPAASPSGPPVRPVLAEGGR